jgi:hypothetical protein
MLVENLQAVVITLFETSVVVYLLAPTAVVTSGERVTVRTGMPAVVSLSRQPSRSLSTRNVLQ